MISTSDIIVKLIKQKGYKTKISFCKDANISRWALSDAIEYNSWTKELLDKVGKTLGKDLSSFVNAQVGVKSKKCL